MKKEVLINNTLHTPLREREREIKLFEAFSGIGSQFHSLKYIANLFGYKVKLVGQFEWYIDAIIAYEILNHNLKIKTSKNKLEMIDFLKNLSLSNNSKTLVNNAWFNSLSLIDLQLVYSAIYNSKNLHNNFFNINAIYENEEAIKQLDIDLLTYSFPCQDLSVQGLQKGMELESKTRSSLVWKIGDLLRILNTNNKLPKVLLLENVKNITSIKNKKQLDKWLEFLSSLGYFNHCIVLNSKDFNSAQSRERFFCISSFKKVDWVFHKYESSKCIKDILNKDLPIKYLFELDSNLLKNNTFSYSKQSNTNKIVLKEISNFNSENIIYDANFCSGTLTASGANSRLKFYHENVVRLVQPKEAFKLMGWKDEDFNKLLKFNYFKDNKLIFLAGNSIVLEVLNEIFKEIIKNVF